MTETATFAGGCFWNVEAAFRGLRGVIDTTAGYTGGRMDDPTYRDVCTGTTGHAEAVQILFDPIRISYDDLLNVFWQCHDPTQLNRQGPEVGTQYRSAIFCHNEAQERAARHTLEEQVRRGRYRSAPRPIVTQIVPAGPFWRAEEYHQHYLEKRGLMKRAA